MLHLVLNASIAWLTALIVVVVIALGRPGETSRRRVLADTAVLLLVAVLALLTMRAGESYYLDAALALSILSFVGSIVVALHAAQHGPTE